MPGLINKDHAEFTRDSHKKDRCFCEACPCRNIDVKHRKTKNVPKNAIVFQLPKYREPKPDTYSHSVYRKDMCNRYLMKQHAALAQNKALQRSKKPPIVDHERFNYKTITETDYRRYNSNETSACKAKFPRIKRKEDFYFSPGEFVSTAKFPSQPVSHEDYCPKVRISSVSKRIPRDVDYPPFEGFSCYDMDYKAPSLEAYVQNRRPRKRVLFD